MATVERETLEERYESLTVRHGAALVERDRLAEKLAALERKHEALVDYHNERGELIDSIGHGGLRVLFATIFGAGDAEDAKDLGRILGKFTPNSAPGHYAELAELVGTLATMHDEYAAQEEIRDWLKAWD